MKILIAAAFVASLTAQTTSVVAKPEGGTAAPKAAPPALNTSKLWRLVNAAKDAHKLADDTPQAKAAAKADEEIQAEIAVLTKACGEGNELANDATVKPPDVVCKSKAAEEAKK